MTVEWLSDNDGPVPLVIVGEADEISYREGGENAMQDSPAVRVFIAGPQALRFWGLSLCGAGSLRGNLRGCAGTGSTTIHRRHFEPPFGQKNAPVRCASLHCKRSVVAG